MLPVPRCLLSWSCFEFILNFISFPLSLSTLKPFLSSYSVIGTKRKPSLMFMAFFPNSSWHGNYTEFFLDIITSQSANQLHAPNLSHARFRPFVWVVQSSILHAFKYYFFFFQLLVSTPMLLIIFPLYLLSYPF